jgi:putative ABC transport system permease protein
MTRLFAYVGEAIAALMRNKARAILTMLGIFIGVGAVDAVYAISTGAATAIDRSFSSGDQPALTIYPDQQQSDVALANLSYRDAELVADGTGSLVRRVIPEYAFFYDNQRAYEVRQGSGNQRVVAFGFSWYGGDSDMQLESGDNLTAQEAELSENAALVSPRLAQKLFGTNDAAVGQSIAMNGLRFRITGVVNANAGTASNYFGGTYYFVLPYTTYHTFDPGHTDALLVWIDAPADETAAQQATLDALHREHGSAAKYTVQSTREALEEQDRVLNIVAAGLTAIGGISLFVAGIGIMNIMLVSVTERTREIGIRKSIGARAGDIVLQFLMEAVMLSLVGGTLGLGLALLIILGASGYLAGRFGALDVPYGAVVVLAFVFSFAVGILFGVYPAFRASRLDPVEALRS